MRVMGEYMLVMLDKDGCREGIRLIASCVVSVRALLLPLPLTTFTLIMTPFSSYRIPVHTLPHLSFQVNLKLFQDMKVKIIRFFLS